MQGLLHVGEATTPGGRIGEPTTSGISQALARLGFELRPLQDRHAAAARRPHDRLRQDRAAAGRRASPSRSRSSPSGSTAEQVPCWITYTTPAVHELIRANLHRAPMFSGQIQSTGPRYCPSIETKIVRFADKARHQLFLEPEGRQHARSLRQRPLDQPAARRAGRHAAADPRPGAGRDPPLRLRHRVRLPAARCS